MQRNQKLPAWAAFFCLVSELPKENEMSYAKSDTQPKKHATATQKDSPQYLPFKIVQIQQTAQGESSVAEAQADFVAQAGMPKALPEEKESERSPSD